MKGTEESNAMDATIGRYTVRLDEHQCVLTHPLGISFDLSIAEALQLHALLEFYRPAMELALSSEEPEEVSSEQLLDQEVENG